MTITRRRLLQISAASVLLGAAAPAFDTVRWRGFAFGSEASITLKTRDRAKSEQVIQEIERMIEEWEAVFSLYRPDSSLSTLNRQGYLDDPPWHLRAMLKSSQRYFDATDGLFDPTVQSLWQVFAKAEGQPDQTDVSNLPFENGFTHVVWNKPGRIYHQLPRVQMTLNGIVQGQFADAVQAHLQRTGFANILVDMGEIAAGDGDWRIGIEDPTFGLITTRTVRNRAIATSSPKAMTFGSTGKGHIINARDPWQEPLWSTVCVEAGSAMAADALSTAMCYMPADAIRARVDMRLAERVTLVSFDGDVRTIAA